MQAATRAVACVVYRRVAVTYIRNGHVSLALERHGDGPSALVFAHGWISSRRMWYEVVERLDPKRFTSFLLDFRGAGLSDRPPLADHVFPEYANDLHAAIAAIGRPVTLIGHSMGGKVAQYVAVTAPAGIERLVLVAPGSPNALEIDPKHHALSAAAFGSREKIGRFQRGAMSRPVSPEVTMRLVDDALIAQRESWDGFYESGRAMDFADRMQALTLPTFVLAGERDPLATPARVKRDVADRIRGSAFVTLKGVGHNMPVEAAGEIALLLERVA